MSIQRYPFYIKIYKGEGRMLFVPLVKHITGYRVESGENINIKEIEDAVKIGESIFKIVES